MTLVDLFSGAGGFSKAAIDAGLPVTQHYFSEIKHSAINNYQYNFPHAKPLGDISKINASSIGKADIVTFGSPCQGLSSAGKNLGFSDPRSGLFLHAAQLVAQLRPSIFIWENVKGLITRTHRADFWTALQILANIGGYTIEWQCVDTGWILPQHRERVYTVGYFGDGGKSQIFPLNEGDFGAIERATEAPSVRTLTAGGNSGGLHSGMTLVAQKARGHFKGGITENAPTLNASSTKTNVAVLKLKEYSKDKGQGMRVYDIASQAPALSAGGGGGVLSPYIDLSNYDIRRLTPVECERLQGFPDNWTKHGINPKNGQVYELSDTARYQLMGNAITKTMAEVIFRKLRQTNV